MTVPHLHASVPRMARAAGLALLALLPAACEDAVPVDKSVVRAIKWATLDQGVAAQERRIAGIVEPVDVTQLSFEISGRVQTLHVRLGDRVSAGDVVAELDREPYELQVRHADAELAAAEAVYMEARRNLERQRILFRDGWIAQARLDSAVAGHDAAESQTGARHAQLDLRRRDLGLTLLRAPFDGVITAKTIEAFEEVANGQPIFELSGERDLKVSLRVPPALINEIAEGQRVTVLFPSEPALAVRGTVTEVGARASVANAFPVTVALHDAPERLRAGMSAEVVFAFDGAPQMADSLMVPMGAILSGEGQDFHVFRYDAGTSTVRRVPVEIEDLHDNAVQIAGDLAAGDIIATAGVEFLADGQEVRLMGREMPFGEGASS